MNFMNSPYPYARIDAIIDGGIHGKAKQFGVGN